MEKNIIIEGNEMYMRFESLYSAMNNAGLSFEDMLGVFSTFKDKLPEAKKEEFKKILDFKIKTLGIPNLKENDMAKVKIEVEQEAKDMISSFGRGDIYVSQDGRQHSTHEEAMFANEEYANYMYKEINPSCAKDVHENILEETEYKTR